MKSAFWKKDWFLGLLISLVLLILGGLGIMRGLETLAYDWGARASSQNPSDKVAVIAIDKRSVDEVGRWPWSRDVYARFVDALSKAKPKVVGYTVFFAEPQRDTGGFIGKLLEFFPKPANEGDVPPLREDQRPIYQALREADEALNADRRLAKSFGEAGNAVLAWRFATGQAEGNPAEQLAESVRKQSLPMAADEAASANAVEVPVAPELAAAASAAGHFNPLRDADGVVRQEALVLGHKGALYPSFALSVLARSNGLAVKDIKAIPGEGLVIGSFKARTGAQARIHPHFYPSAGGKPAFSEDSFADVLSGRTPADKYRDKIVLIGLTAPDLAGSYATPASQGMSPVQLEAQVVSNLLQGHYYVVPGWAPWAALGIFVLVAAYLMFVLPRMDARKGAILSLVLLAVLVGAHFALMTGGGIWLQLMLPTVLIVTGHVVLVFKRSLEPRTVGAKSESESAASNRMMALAFQGQGQLDTAFDYLRRCPLDESVMDNLYNLGLNFERKTQFEKAEAVFRYMAQFNPKFRDLETRLSKAPQEVSTVVLGADAGGRRTEPPQPPAAGARSTEPTQPPASARASDAAAPAQASSGKSMLGRYEIDRELGKGAMGVVYLGKDPRIGRIVAIKTMAIAQEFEAAEVAEVKERFFREAETAGRLSHPNIVTIFDVGEDRGLCYIAMEVLKGKDLVPYTKLEALLAVEKAVSVIARVADALGYAHKQGIVHRDIKPANVMFEPVSDQVKVADFGIARITDSSKTKTGMVLGTPSYMSPEQLSGQKVDGRSDLFSLAVTLYQLVCGKLPFEGKSMAQLMFKITNESPPDILSINPSLPPGLVAFLDKAMAKETTERYQTGEEFAAALRASFAVSSAGAASSGVDIDL